MKKSLFTILSLIFTKIIISQVNLTPTSNTLSLINSFFGGGANISNVVVNCPSGAIGTFTTTSSCTTLGIGSGIVLATGNISNINQPAGNFMSDNLGTTYSDPQLTSIEPSATNDVCILEFDIQPYCNQLLVKFVFGSEEYPEYVGLVNDAFGFFITGPGPACNPGGYNNTNVATLPNGTPISINNVNSGSNSAYYNSSSSCIVFDGFTTPITRTINVCPCATYHFKIAIADASDHIYDSGVFLDFIQCSMTLTATTSYTNSTGCSCTGVASATASGTSGPYTYTWMPGNIVSQTATNLCPGTYTVLINDNVSCSPTYSTTVNIGGSLSSMTLSTITNSVSCNGGTNGSATVNVTGGATPYSYTWTPFVSTTSVATGLSAGTYTVIVKDNNNCTTNTVITITQPPALSLTATQTQSVSCNGGNNGSASATASGGLGGYTYTWTPTGGNSSSATGLTAGIYTVTVKDANNCSATATIQIVQPPALSLTATQTQSVSCNGGNNGSASATVTGGVVGYTYTWTPTGGNSSSATGLTAGIYTVTVKDANNCSITATTQIVQPPALSLTATQTQSVSCNGGNNGSASATASGGVGGYTYTWMPTGGNSSTATGLTAGVYTVTIKDANNCSTTASTQIVQASAYTLATASQSANCSTPGSATVNVSGATPAYSYTWMPSGGNSNIATGLTPGTYTCTIKDANNCYTTAVVNITGAPVVNISSVNINSVSCNGGTNGSATVNVTGGATPYSYTWTPSVSTTSVATGLSAGTYSVNVMDNNNCTTNTVITITQPPALSLTATQTQSVSCNGGNNGSASATETGGVGGYTYTWTPTGGNSSSATGLTAGIYTVTVKDANNCSITATTQIVQPPALSLTATQTQSVSCNGGNNGSASATATGGVGGYTYTWTPTGGNSSNATGLTAGYYTVAVSDGNLCGPLVATVQIQEPPALSISIITQSANCSTPGSATANVTGGIGGYTYTWTPSGGNSAVATGLSPGNYSVNVQDINGCAISGVANIAGAPALSIVSISTNSVSCNGGTNGSATVNVTGGATPYSYTWTPSVSTTSVATGLSAGTYSVNVMDNNFCSTNTVITITQPPALSLTATQTQSVSCNGGNNGSASATATGGVGVYTYTWMPTGGNSSSASGLSFGTYTISVLDANNCSISTTVQIQEPPALSLTAMQTQSVSCNGGNNGSASATATGGVGGYTYTWTPTGGNSSGATGLTAGYYTVAVSDGNLCGPILATVQIQEPPALSITVTNTNVTCYGYSDGGASANVSGGVLPYSYTWVPTGGNLATANGLTAGNYTINVSDANNCFTYTTVTVNQPTAINLMTVANPTICYGNSANISASASGGTSPYTYSWNPNISSTGGPVMVNPTVTTNYQVSVTDANGCTCPTSVITVYVKPPLSAVGFSTNVCDGKTVSLYPTITSPGNGMPYGYTWSNGMTTGTITVTGNSALGNSITYSVMVDDGCTIPSAVAEFTVNIYPNPVLSFSADIVKGCIPINVNFVANSGSVSVSSYTWIFGNGMIGNTNPASTIYSVAGVYSPTLIAESQYGCISQTVLVNYIEAYPYPVADFSADSWTVSPLEPTVNFINLSTGGTSYMWDFGDTGSGLLNNSSQLNPSHEYLYSGTYYVTLMVENGYGCRDYVVKPIYVDIVYNVYIPNVFTPDGNGLNDVFQPKGIGIDESEYKMLIFDRWGELIYESNNFQKGWDGSVKGSRGKAKEDVYVYKIFIKDLKGKIHEYVGHVTCLPNSNEE